MDKILSIRLRKDDIWLKAFFGCIKKNDRSFWARELIEEAIKNRLRVNGYDPGSVNPEEVDVFELVKSVAGVDLGQQQSFEVNVVENRDDNLIEPDSVIDELLNG